MPVTAQEVRDACLACGTGLSIQHHKCSLCDCWVHYQVENGELFFAPGCGCSWSPMEPREWQDAADWINVQDNDKARNAIRAKFGMVAIVEGQDANAR